jgi:hypothetical protein
MHPTPEATMDELDRYECFGVPAHVWVDGDAVASTAVSGATRRNWVHREAAMLGMEAMPSPALGEFELSK